MKKHIVFVVGRYTPEYSANVNCIKNVISELEQQDFKISIVCASTTHTGVDVVDNAVVHRIQYTNYASRLSACKSKMKKRVLVLGHFLKSVLLLPFYPNVTPSITCKVYRKLLEIQRSEGIDCLIGVFQPYFPIKASLKFKKAYKSIPVVGYYLDVMKGTNKPFGTTQHFFEMLCDKAQKKDFSKLDRVLLPECSWMYYDTEYYLELREKMIYLNFPTLLKENFIGETVKCSMNLTFAGTTNKIYRNPTKAIRLFTRLKEFYPNLVFNLYGGSNMRDELKQLESQSDGAFVYHGTVNKDVADTAIQQADYLVNFGNDVSGMVPSKIFELISTGKSIIHFTPGNEDSSVEYLNKYPKTHIMSYQESEEELLLKMKNVFDAKTIDIDFDTIERLFFSATPKAVAEKITAVMEE